MDIRDYEHGSEHDDIISHWFNLRGMNPRGLLELPHFGCIVSVDSQPVAIGFLRLIEDKFAMFDSLITNPRCDAKTRDECLDYLFKGLIAKARELNIIQIFGFTLDDNTVERSIKHGFKKQPYISAILDL